MSTEQLPDTRRARLIEHLKVHKRATIEALAAQFGVSTMTVHRDVAELVKTGLVQKVHGGVVLAEAAPAVLPAASAGERCEMCGVPAARMPFVAHLPDGSTRTMCCAHCGLMLLPQLEDGAVVLVTDFLYGRTLTAKAAVYLVGSAVQVCCAPSVLCFVTMEDAQRFACGFGGQVLTCADAMAALHHL